MVAMIVKALNPSRTCVKKGMDANEALEKAKGSYGRFKDAVKYIDPRNE